MVEWCQCLLQPWVRYLASIVLGLLLIVHVLPPRTTTGGMMTAQALHSTSDDKTAGWLRGKEGIYLAISLSLDLVVCLTVCMSVCMAVP